MLHTGERISFAFNWQLSKDCCLRARSGIGPSFQKHDVTLTVVFAIQSYLPMIHALFDQVSEATIRYSTS